jgi:8-oxo-dGTP pyrophosphatase MutT (NUDIX family)
MNITVEQHTIENRSLINYNNHCHGQKRIKPLDLPPHQLLAASSQPTVTATFWDLVLSAWHTLYAGIHAWYYANQQCSAFAFIAVGQGEQRRYLLQWNETWGVFNLIGGKLDNSKGDAGLLSRALLRELEEELGLKCREDFEILRCLKTVKMRQYSRRENKTKNYRFDIYDVTLFPQLLNTLHTPNYAARWFSTCYENVFASAEEIANLATANNRVISSTTKRILQALGELP